MGTSKGKEETEHHDAMGQGGWRGEMRFKRRRPPNPGEGHL